MRKVLLTLILLLTLSAVYGKMRSQNTITMKIASYKTMAMGMYLQECYLVKYPGDTEWSIFYSNIEGFDELYEEGNEYKIKVQKVLNDPGRMDVSSFNLVLKRIISITPAVITPRPLPGLSEE